MTDVSNRASVAGVCRVAAVCAIASVVSCDAGGAWDPCDVSSTAGALSLCQAEPSFVDVQTLDEGEPFAMAAVALDRDTLVTGGNHHVHVYRRRHAQPWTLEQTLVPEPDVPSSPFGRGLALKGDTLVVGAGAEQGSPPDYPWGYADVYRRRAGQWKLEARLQPDLGMPLTCSESAFGRNIALGDDVVVLSANRMGLGPGGCGQGAVFVFQRCADSWTQLQVIAAPPVPISNPPLGYPNYDTNFGASLSMSGDTLVIGQPGRGLTPPLQGAIHVFAWGGTSFALQQAFVAPGVAYDTADKLGLEAVVNGRILAAAEDGNLRTFVRQGATWSARAHVPASTPGIRKGHALARGGNRLFLSDVGAVQVFELGANGDLAPLPPLTVDGAQGDSALAVDERTLVVAGDHGVHILQRE